VFWKQEPEIPEGTVTVKKGLGETESGSEKKGRSLTDTLRKRDAQIHVRKTFNGKKD